MIPEEIRRQIYLKSKTIKFDNTIARLFKTTTTTVPRIIKQQRNIENGVPPPIKKKVGQKKKNPDSHVKR